MRKQHRADMIASRLLGHYRPQKCLIASEPSQSAVAPESVPVLFSDSAVYRQLRARRNWRSYLGSLQCGHIGRGVACVDLAADTLLCCPYPECTRVVMNLDTREYPSPMEPTWKVTQNTGKRAQLTRGCERREIVRPATMTRVQFILAVPYGSALTDHDLVETFGSHWQPLST